MLSSRPLAEPSLRVTPLRFIVASLLASLGAALTAQTIPSGLRWKDIPSATDPTATEIGSETDAGYGNNQYYQWSPLSTVLARECNLIQPTFYSHWNSPGVDTYTITNLNTWTSWAGPNGKKLLVHFPLGPDSYMPPWLATNSYTPDQLKTHLDSLINQVITGNGNAAKVDIWNVVNEPFNAFSDVPNGLNVKDYRPDSRCVLNALGWEDDLSGLTGTDKIHPQHPKYIRYILDRARTASGSTAGKILELRENGMETDPNSDRAKAYYQLALHLVKSGAQLDAVGLQCHFSWDINTPPNLTGFKQLVTKFKAIGLRVYVNELDIVLTGAGMVYNDANYQNVQKQRYYIFVKACREVGVDMICSWGLSDASSWQTSRPPLYDQISKYPLFFTGDDYNTAKPSYYGVQYSLVDTSKFYIRARGTAGGERMELLVDGVSVATWYLSKELTDYCYTGSYTGVHNIRIAFTNDGLSLTGKDKNILLDRISINGLVKEAEYFPNSAGSVTGGYQGIWSNGYVDFGWAAGY
ncbi:MAG: endo-1,4-beta-xylanase [Opitutaceae bacterium]